MFQFQGFGPLGADVKENVADGNKFYSFRIADNYQDKERGISRTQWIDVVFSGKENLLPYLKKGQLVFIQGGFSTRVYSSPKDRCMKAGLTIHARRIELIGARRAVPSRLVDAEGVLHEVSTLYHVDDVHNGIIADAQGNKFLVSDGWVVPVGAPVDSPAVPEINKSDANSSEDGQVF